MSKMIGLARPLRISWLNKTVDLILEGNPVESIKEELNQYLSFEIGSPTSLRKTRESLINVWTAPSEGSSDVRTLALSLYPTRISDNLPLHWCMLAVIYPIFADICSLIGKVTAIEESFTTAWIREKLYESWGERSTLEVPVKNILRSLLDFGALEKVKTGVYKAVVRPVTDEKTICLLVLTILSLGKKAYYEIPELTRVPLFFPFEYSVTHEMLHNTANISLSNFGGKTVVTSNARS